jgi:hypothetical protein
MRHCPFVALLLLAACTQLATPERPAPRAEPAPAELCEQALAAERANDSAQALALMTRSAEGGWAEAQYTLGLWNYLATHTPRDAQAAASWFEKAAHQDHVEAQLMLAQMLLFGSGVAPNARLALRWFTRGAELGSAEAQYRTGLAHYEGVGTQENPVEAARWMKKAAEQGHLDAMYHLAVLILDETEPPEAARAEKAFAWFLQAAEAGHGPSQLAVGESYEKGRGVTQDVARARAWYERARQSDNAKVRVEAIRRLGR